MREGAFKKRFMAAPNVVVRCAIPQDAQKLAPNLRSADLLEIRQNTGFPPAVELIRPFAAPGTKKIYAIDHDGIVLGMFGVNQSRRFQKERVGVPWFLGTDHLMDRYWRRLVRESPRWIEVLMEDYDALENLVCAENTVHVAWIRRMGFTIVGDLPKYGKGQSRFLRFRMEKRQENI